MNAEAKKLQAALLTLADARFDDLAAVVGDLDGIDSRQGLLAAITCRTRWLAVAVSHDACQLAKGHEEVGEYGNALFYRWQARAASEYAAHIEAANQSSSDAEANGTMEDDEVPQTLEEYREEIETNGLPN